MRINKHIEIKLDSIVLFVLAIPFIMTFRIGPGETPYWLFGLIFLGVFSYFLLDMLRIRESIFFKLKQVVLWFLIFATIGSAVFSAILVRHETHPIYMVHDIVLQQEEAIRFLVNGVNPYSTTYFDTFLEEWHYSDQEINPALYHFVMQPFYVIFALPFYFLSISFFGFFDGRIPLFFLFFTMLFIASLVVRDNKKKLLFIILLAFNPAMLGYTLEGRSDMFMFSFAFLGFYLLHIKKDFLAGIPLGLAFAIKQSIWPIFPFYFAYLFFKNNNLKKTLKDLSLFVLTFSVIVLPFVFWDAKGFFESTVLYLSGNTANSYPISGYGFGMILRDLQIIENKEQHYPFVFWQIIIGLPLIIILIKKLKEGPSVGRMILFYAIFLFVFWYFSRYFNNSHLGYLSVVFVTAYFWSAKK